MIKNQSGFSLVELMFGAALLAMVALAMAQLFKQQRFSLKRVDDFSELTTVHNSWAKTFSSAENCNATIKSILPTSAALTAQTLSALYICDTSAGKCIDDNSLPGGEGFTAYTPGAYIAKEFIKVNDYTSNRKKWMVTGIQLMDARTTSGWSRIRLTYKRVGLSNDEFLNKDLLLNLKMIGGKFIKCVDSEEANLMNIQKDLCETFNRDGSTTYTDGQMAYWDLATSTCKISGVKDCTALGYSIDGINADGTMNCKKIMDNSFASSIQSSSSTTCSATQNPQLQFNPVTKKMEIACVTP